MLRVLAQYRVEVAGSGDQEVVEAFPAQCSDESFRDRVRAGCSYRGADDADVSAGEDGVERRGELAVSVADQEPEPVGAVAELHEQVAGLLDDPVSGGVGGDSGEVHASSWVNHHVFMPPNWKHKYPEFYKQLRSYQKKGKNKNDDAPDVLAAIYERVANPARSKFRVRTA